MKPSQFQFHTPTTLADAVGLLDDLGDDARPLAGGQSLVPMLAMRLAMYDHLVDLNRIPELVGVSEHQGRLRIGAMTRQRDAERHPATLRSAPLLAEAISKIGHFQIRNRGTVGGSLAHADPAAELPAAALALDAEFEITSPQDQRVVSAAGFFVGTWATSLQPGEVLSAILVKSWNGRCGFAVEEISRRHGDFAVVGAACGVGLGPDGAVERSSIALFGIAATPVRAFEAERLMVGRCPGDDLTDVGTLATADQDPEEDIHATGSYRRRVGAVVVRRALQRATEAASRA